MLFLSPKKLLNHVCSLVRRLVNYLHVQAEKTWYNLRKSYILKISVSKYQMGVSLETYVWFKLTHVYFCIKT